MAKICLCMIVKNESAIIERCLDSAKPILDYVFISDTGSTDGTQELIKNWLAKNEIQGEVQDETFQNFGYNRTWAVSQAKKTFPGADYLLLLDADEMLEIDAAFNKEELVADSYMTMQYNHSLKYWYHRLLKTDAQWECVGVTHEYWDSPASRGAKQLSTLVVNDLGDGGSKKDKFIRDEKLLTRAIADPKTDLGLKSRYIFYLANTYHDTDQWKKAIDWYQKRIDLQGWAEEVYYSYYRIGLCCNKLAERSPKAEQAKYKALAVAAFQDAWNYRPARAEPLYELSRMYRIEKKYHLASLFASRGLEIPFPAQDILFIDYTVYDYLLDYELSISGYYVDKEKAKLRQRKLEKRTDLPWSIMKDIQHNARFYGENE